MKIKNATFKTSIAAIKNLPQDLCEIAFSGKSNSGKSSLINFLTNNRKLAKTSGTAGKTKLLNYFTLNTETGAFYFVDLPGYGYTATGKAEKENFFNLTESYFLTTEKLKHTFVLMDIRNGASEGDKILIQFLAYHAMPFSVVGTKADKVSRAEADRLQTKLAASLAIGRDNILIVSALNKTGAEKLFAQIEKSLNTNQ